MRTALLIVLITCCSNGSIGAQTLPKTIVRDLKTNKPIAFDACIPQGQVTLISFWATWCIPGKRQAKTIIRNMAAWKQQTSFNYITIAVDQPDNAALASKYAASQRWNFPCYVDANSELKKAMNFLALPYILIIDAKGHLVYTHTGYDEGTQILEQLKKTSGRKTK